MKPKILVVEDDHDYAGFLKGVIEKAGGEVLHEDEAKAAIRFIKLGGNYDLLLSDWSFHYQEGGMRGIEACGVEIIAASKQKNPDCKAYLLSALGGCIEDRGEADRIFDKANYRYVSEKLERKVLELVRGF
jgi:CheY-like chemotaxis protein